MSYSVEGHHRGRLVHLPAPRQPQLCHSSQIVSLLKSASHTDFESRGSCFTQGLDGSSSLQSHSEITGRYFGGRQEWWEGNPLSYKLPFFNGKVRQCEAPIASPILFCFRGGRQERAGSTFQLSNRALVTAVSALNCFGLQRPFHEQHLQTQPQRCSRKPL